MDIKFSERNGIKPDNIKNIVYQILDILEAVGVPFEGVTDRSKEQMALACMALCSIKNRMEDSYASQPLTTKQIIGVWNTGYSDKTSTGSYDSVRDGALRRLLDNGIVIKESGVKNSSTAGYYVSQAFIELVKSYGKDDWEQKIGIFKNSINANKRNESVLEKNSLNMPRQQIFFGAPGTGKSDAIERIVHDVPHTRTTFHPDSDYASFVGAYKPTMKPVADKYKAVAGKDEEITYSFIPQGFLKAYCAAWKQIPEPYFLVIEEINRGNCAQIFGDLFQLLDRNAAGYSKYEIAADDDIRKFLSTDAKVGFGALTDEQKRHFPKEEIWKGEELVFPPNLYIWATMNTSDQSLFPIDSAFKRRWEWKYIKITNGYEKKDNGEFKRDTNGNKIKLDWEIETSGEDWYGFICQINRIISNMTSSADKQLGYFFCQANEDKKITTETFVSKVIFYLWNDVFKDYGFEDADLFKYKTLEGDKEVEKDLTFPDFYDEDGNVAPDVVKQFIENVMAWEKDKKKDNN